jgi:hypothetical protein
MTDIHNLRPPGMPAGSRAASSAGTTAIREER